jgi:hypothetical protein
MNRSSIVIAVLVGFGLAACGEQQKPAAKAEPKIAKPEAAAPAPPPPPAAPAAGMKKEEQKVEKK